MSFGPLSVEGDSIVHLRTISCSWKPYLAAIMPGTVFLECTFFFSDRVFRHKVVPRVQSFGGASQGERGVASHGPGGGAGGIPLGCPAGRDEEETGI